MAHVAKYKASSVGHMLAHYRRDQSSLERENIDRDLARKLAPRSARMTTRALKRDLAALEEEMSPVTLASEARDAARASNARRGNVPQRDRGQSR